MKAYYTNLYYLGLSKFRLPFDPPIPPIDQYTTCPASGLHLSQSRSLKSSLPSPSSTICRLGDRPAMRLSGIQSSRLFHIPRRFRTIQPPQDDDVFANSLRKTLEAHRASNRARLIRKTYPRAPSPGLFRPYIPPENRAGYQPPLPAPLSLPVISPELDLSGRRAPKSAHAGGPQNLAPTRRMTDPRGMQFSPWVMWVLVDWVKHRG